jgi:Mrp family chromosome partitioning ATPase
MSTNQAFIKAYRQDPPRSATPSPTKPVPQAHVRQPAHAEPVAAWPSSVEIVTADYRWPTTPIAAPIVEHTPQPIIGKRPLSSFSPEQAFEPPPLAEPTFTPETTISAFRWPAVCRALWQQYADQYERVADILLSRAGHEPHRGGMVGVCSLHAGDGATTTLLCLAVALAARKRSVILVDANFRAPRLAGLLGVQPTTPWQDVLEQGLSVAEAVIRAENDGVDLLPLGLREPGRHEPSSYAPSNHEPNGAQLASGLQTVITAGVLRYAYEIVLVDLGAILAPRSFVTISHLIRNLRIDAAVGVTDPKHAERDDLAVAGELLDETGCELLGLIENRAAKPQAANATDF